MPRNPHATEGLRFRIVLKPGFALGPGKADLLEAIHATASSMLVLPCPFAP